MEEQKLKDYFLFDETDLGANRMGSLTEKQKTRLSAELKSTGRGRKMFSSFLFLVAFVGVIVAVVVWLIPETGWGMRIGFTIGFGLVWPALYGLIAFALWPSDKYSSLELDKTTGRVNIIKVQNRDSDTGSISTRYDLYIGDRRFLADNKIGGVLVQGDIYTVYFLKYSNKIISAEFISKAN